VFELMTDDHHDHIVCDSCGKVEEFFDHTIEQQQERIAQKFGYKITDHSMYLYGICAACQAETK